VYRLLDGSPDVAAITLATWITPSRGQHETAFDDFLADGVDPEHGSLWRRQLVLGPAPELCLLGRQSAAGVRATRLPHDWTSAAAVRAAL
jgi:hypothetical protein